MTKGIFNGTRFHLSVVSTQHSPSDRKAHCRQRPGLDRFACSLPTALRSLAASQAASYVRVKVRQPQSTFMFQLGPIHLATVRDCGKETEGVVL